jgi:hypothetical protein
VRQADLPSGSVLLLFMGAVCDGLDFSRRRLDLNASASLFRGCSFAGVKFGLHNYGGSNRTATEYVDCDFDWVVMSRMQASENACFERCTFRGAKLSNWRAYHAQFIDCDFSGAQLREVEFTGRPFDVERDRERNRQFWAEEQAKYPNLPPLVELERARNEFRGNDFREAKLTRVSFTWGIDVDAQSMPVGPRYLRLDRPRERIERARAVVARWSDDVQRERALGTLRHLSYDSYREQDVLFVCLGQEAAPGGQFHAVYELLEGVLP